MDGILLNSQTKQSTKRKRDQLNQASINSSIKSISQLSISQEASKKLKHFTQETILSFDNYSKDSNQETSTLYKTSKYLKMPRKLLLHSLRLQLNLPLMKRKEQNFILSRLQILDEQFRLDQIRYLYQNYFDLGVKFQIWPVSLKIILSMCILLYRLLFFEDDILKIIQSNKYNVIQNYLEDYVTLLGNRIDQFSTNLMTQTSFCPSTLCPLEVIDIRLKEFVRLHHIDLICRINYKVNKAKSNTHGKQLFKQLSYYYLTTEHVIIIIIR